MSELRVLEERKEGWTDAPATHFESLTFADLNAGDEFIGMPVPGDNEGHGGFKGVHYIFVKIEEVHNSRGSRSNAMRKVHGDLIYFSGTTPVLRLK